MSNNKFEKQPLDVLDYDIELKNWFKESPGDDIQSVTLSIASGNTGEDADLVLGPGTHPEYSLIGSPSERFKVWVGGGVSGVRYKVDLKVVTQANREKELELFITVRDR